MFTGGTFMFTGGTFMFTGGTFMFTGGTFAFGFALFALAGRLALLAFAGRLALFAFRMFWLRFRFAGGGCGGHPTTARSPSTAVKIPARRKPTIATRVRCVLLLP
jgi:hypothetical protein